MIKALHGFPVRSPSRYVTILPSLVAKFGGSGDKIVLVCHLIKDLYDHPVKLYGYRHSGCRDIILFDFHVTLQGHMMKVLHELKVRSTSR